VYSSAPNSSCSTDQQLEAVEFGLNDSRTYHISFEFVNNCNMWIKQIWRLPWRIQHTYNVKNNTTKYFWNWTWRKSKSRQTGSICLQLYTQQFLNPRIRKNWRYI